MAAAVVAAGWARSSARLAKPTSACQLRRLCQGASLFGNRNRCRGSVGCYSRRSLVCQLPSSLAKPVPLVAAASTGEKSWQLCSKENAPVLAVAPWICAVVPAALLPGSLADNEYRWIFESIVGSGSVTMGLPGIVSLGIFLNPMFEAIPRFRKQGEVGKMPLLPYSAMATQGVVWTAYGLILGNPAVWTPNLCAAILGLYYSGVYRSYCPAGADWLPYRFHHHALVFLATAGLCVGACMSLPTDSALTVLGLTGNVMTVIMFGGPLAAIRTVLKDKNTRSMALGFTCVVNLNCNLWFFYAYFMMNDPYIYVQDGIGLLLTTVQMALFARYGIHR